MKEVIAEDEWCAEAYLETNYDEFSFEDYEETVRKFLMFNMLNLTSQEEIIEYEDV